MKLFKWPGCIDIFCAFFLRRFLLSSKATIAIINVVEELSTMMNQLPLYTNEFLEMILQILGGYLLSCTEAYKGDIVIVEHFIQILV